MNTTSTPYDDVFRTMLNDCSRLILAVVNEIFQEQYNGNEEIIFSPNEHFINRQDGSETERITDTCFVVKGGAGKKYHIECQSTPDSSMLVRIFEYASQIALDDSWIKNGVLEVEFPRSAVLFLRHNRATPDGMRIRIAAPGGELEYGIPVMKLQEYTLEEIFEKKMLFLVPFYLFIHEKSFEKYAVDEKELEMLRQEYGWVRKRLEELCMEKEIDEYTKCTVVDMTNKVAENLAAKYEEVRKGVKEAMGGKVLDYEAKRIRNEGVSQGISQGISQGRQQTLIELVRDGLLSIEEAAERLQKSTEEMRLLL